MDTLEPKGDWRIMHTGGQRQSVLGSSRWQVSNNNVLPYGDAGCWSRDQRSHEPGLVVTADVVDADWMGAGHRFS